MIKFILKKILNPIDPQFTWVIYSIDENAPTVAKWVLEGEDYEIMRGELIGFRDGHQWWSAARLKARWENHCQYSTTGLNPQAKLIRMYYATINL